MPDQSISIISEKSERLSAAIHLVTGLIKDNEPIKRTLRFESIELVKDTLPQNEKSELVTQTLWSRRIVRLLSLLTVARTSGLISEMNYQMLHSEYASLVERIDGSGKDNLSALTALTPTRSQRLLQGRLRDRIYDKGHSKGHMSFMMSDRTKQSSTNTNDRIRQKIQSTTNTEIPKENKEEKVVDFLKDNDSASIKDIHTHVSSVSEKTVQRLLTSLISKGLVLKEGERRWSRYSLKK